MDDGVQNGLQAEQWLPTFEKGEKRPSSLGSGALRFIRTRSSIRRELKRQCNRSKSGDSYGNSDGNGGNGGGGGGLGKWLREHLGGGSRGSHDVSVVLPSKGNGNAGTENTGNDKSFGRTICASQNLYCSLPREHGRHINNGTRKTGHGGSLKPQGHDRPRSNSVNHREKSTSSDLGPLTRGGPIYSSEGKSLKKRNRDRRRHSLNETHEQSRHRRRSMEKAEESIQDAATSENKAAYHDAESKIKIDTTSPSVTKVSPRDTYLFDDHELESSVDPAYKYETEEGELEGSGVQEEEDKATLRTAQEDSDSGRRSDVRKASDDEKSREVEEEDVGEEESEVSEEIAPLARVSVAEKAEEEAQEVVESDHVLAEIPAEVLASRETMIEKVKELLAEQPELWRRNKLLEQCIMKYIKKNRNRILFARTEEVPEDINEVYKQVLIDYKLRFDEIVAQRENLSYEINSYQNKVDAVLEEDRDTFDELLKREREVGIGLVYAKTGKTITEKSANEMIHRQILRRNILTRDRYNYIIQQHRDEKLQTELRSLETLGEGMTSMDYEALLMVNITHKDKLDERNRELEKLCSKIEEVVNSVAHFKEKQVCLVEDIEREEKELKEFREKTMKVRERINNLRLSLRDVREVHAKKRLEAGLLVAQPELRQMERTMKLLDVQKNNIELIKKEIQQYAPPNGKRWSKDSGLSHFQ